MCSSRTCSTMGGMLVADTQLLNFPPWVARNILAKASAFRCTRFEYITLYLHMVNK